jgi:hypothetical protein
MELQQYDFNIQHRPGKNNANADALSRLIPENEQDNSSKEVFMLTINENDDEEIEWYVSSENNETSSERSQEEINLEKELMSQFSHAPLITMGYQCPKNELEDIFKENIKIKQVIANQPITKGGSQCNYSCDIENHHIHTYCKACKRNLPYRTIEHHCIIRFGPGQIQPDMNPNYLINDL